MAQHERMAELGPQALLDLLLAQLDEPDTGATGWRLDWSKVSPAAREAWRAELPPRVGFRTSGSVQRQPRQWWRTQTQLIQEVDLLRGIAALDTVDGVISFAPACHLYGWLFTVLIPNVLGVPVWYEAPGPDASFGYPGIEHPLLAMIPSAWSALRRHLEGGGPPLTPGAVAVHSTALLPAAARALIGGPLAPDLVAVELFGSTETGLVAVRWWSPGRDRDWELAGDVSFAGMAADGREEQLRVASPRLASDGPAAPPDDFVMDDWVQVSGDRRFTFGGRRTRIVNVNGRRIDLDGVEEKLRAALAVADLACVPVTDPIRGEHYELLVVPLPGTTTTELRPAVRRLIGPPRPGRIRLVESIDRSPTGKLRRVQPPHLA
ncbi:MAG: long-chain fatty acid--CoA ligase [Actinomycetota bacterium]|nr:long-chain fatty acid--CoA ligase [Actinomycetota bacterium]